MARHPDRPVASDYISHVLEDFVELHGDKAFGDDSAIVTGFATLRGRRFLLVGHRKGRTTKERLECNFGCAHPEGYRKALRKMQLAERLGLPIVTMINTPGAYPGIGAEERGQAAAIARNILEMFAIEVPIISLVIGEGGSGGALGIGVGDRVGMMENSYYSVISPEGCAAILWKSGEKAPEAAEALKLTSKDLLRLGLVDEVIDAYNAFRAVFSDPGRALFHEWEPGRLLVFDNWRCFHGRTSFTGDRHFKGCYTNHEDLEGAYRVAGLMAPAVT